MSERGPSGTGHDTAGTVCPKCGMLGAAFVTHVCMTASEVPDPPAMRWLNPPPDPPVAVPGPASVSPAELSGVELIAAERQRQIEVEGWTPGHDDDEHDSGELVYAAISYAYSPWSDMRQAPDGDHTKPSGTVAPMTWPWEDAWWKPTPKDRVRELVKAGALIAAEIDRLQRNPDGR